MTGLPRESPAFRQIAESVDLGDTRYVGGVRAVGGLERGWHGGV